MRASTLFLLCLLLALPTLAVAEAPSLEANVSDAAVTVGDRVAVQVMARGGENLMWGELQVAVEKAGSWEVVDGPTPVAGSRPPAWQVTMVAMEVGELALPAFQTTVRPPDGEPQAVLLVDSPVVTVASVLPPDQEVEPAPLRDPLGVSGFPWEWVLPVVLLLLPLLAVLAWWWRRRRRISADAAIRALPPFEELQVRLAAVAERIGREPSEGICDRMAASLRRYLERRSGEPAQEMTSFELRLMCRRLRWPDAVQRGVPRVMEVADSVRFGRRRVSDSILATAVDDALEVGRSVEEHLTPKPDSAEGPGAEVAR